MSKIFLLVTFLFVSCSPQATTVPTALPSTASEAQGVLIQFFDLLNARKYAEADLLYGGDYEQLQIFNPEGTEHVALWSSACEFAGLQCLKVRTATFKLLQGDTYVYQVEFSNPDGSRFVLGPCCGANETEMPPISQFDYRVKRIAGGKFLVMDLPPYTP